MTRLLVVATILIIFMTSLSGCTWVPLTPDANRVRIAASDSLDECTQVGTTKARTKVRIGIFNRNKEKVARELTTLARNDAPELGGNTVVAEGPVSADGMQRFAIYDCPRTSDSSP